MLVAIDTIDQSWIPERLNRDAQFFRASRHSRYILASSPLDADNFNAIMADYDYSFAAGASEIWEKFSDLRGEFWVNVERYVGITKISGWAPLRYTIKGDEVLSTNTKIYMSRANLQIPPPAGDEPEVLSTPLRQIIEEAPWLSAPGLDHNISCKGKIIIFVDNFSTYSKDQTFIRFISSRDIVEHTDLLELNQSIKDTWSPGHSFNDIFPPSFTGAFSFDYADPAEEAFAAVIVERIITSAGISANIPGAIVQVTRLSEGGWGTRGFGGERWYKPYSDVSQFNKLCITEEDRTFWEFMDIIENSTYDKFIKAKEDYRLLALETVGDVRHQASVAALQIVQLWMAIERLLPFRHETTLQLSLALCAYWDASSRVDSYDHLKRSYKLRSDIAHGYNFKRDNVVYMELNYLSDLFRRAIRSSLQFNDSEKFRSSLVDHVLRGRDHPYDAILQDQ